MLAPRNLRRTAKYVAVAGATAVALMSVAAATRDTPTLESVVVMPFANLTGDPANDYLSAGTSGELSRRLSRMSGFRVSAPAREGVPIDPGARATYRLSGHVQQAGALLRITVQLSDQQRDRLLWAEKYEGPRERALQLEDALAEAAATALGREVLRARETAFSAMFSLLPFGGLHRPDVAKGGTANNAAYDKYMRGRHLFEMRTLPEALAASDLLIRATELDPQFAAPYATLSALQQVLMDFHYRPHAELLKQAELYAERAVALDPNLPDARVALASVRQMQSRWDEAEAEFKATLEMHPTFSRAYRWYGGMLLQFGRSDECLRLVQKARELDPYDMMGHTFYGLALIYSNRPEEAARHLEPWVARGDLRHANLILGQAYAILAGKPGTDRDGFVRAALEQSAILRTRAIADAKDAPAGDTTPRTEFADFVGALAWSFRGNLEAARPYVERLESERTAGRVSPSILARVYAVQRRTGDALRALEESEVEGDRELMYLSVSPLYQHIRAEPRFAALVERMHLNR
jgi:TolB-like protein